MQLRELLDFVDVKGFDLGVDFAHFVVKIGIAQRELFSVE